MIGAVARATLAAVGRRAGAQALPAAMSKARGLADAASLKKTALYDLHAAAGAKLVDFAGWSMPIQYQDSIMDSTKHCREGASLFDVSHMCGTSFKGADATKFIESLVVGDIGGLKDGTGTLSVMPNEDGGIIDDTVVTKVSGDHVYMVLNAGCAEKDLAHINAHLSKFSGDVSMTIHDDRAMLALQGPKAAPALQSLTSEDLSKLYFGMFKVMSVNGAECWVTRTGYTGEDGFEISAPNSAAVALTEALLTKDGVKLAGLGARDSLRLEAGLCLYGNDIDMTTSPIDAGLTWTIAKSRRDACDFVGGAAIKAKLAEGATKRRVGLVVEKGAPARNGAAILDSSGAEVGIVTSGGFSPCLGKNIAMGYVPKDLAKAGTEVSVSVRGKTNPATVTKMPFVQTTYYRPS